MSEKYLITEEERESIEMLSSPCNITAEYTDGYYITLKYKSVYGWQGHYETLEKIGRLFSVYWSEKAIKERQVEWENE